MDVITMARDLGAEMQKSTEYLAHRAATTAADGDEALQNLIGEFNLKKVALSQEVQKEEKDQEKIAELNDQVKDIYTTIMTNENMTAYNETKAVMDKTLNFLQQIIVYAANGEDPYTVQDETESACSGSCSSCSGCH